MAWSTAASDEALLAGFASGDPHAAAAFVRRFQTRVYGLSLTIVRDGTLAEEAAQETFVRAWRYADRYDQRRGPVAGWLLTIARNQAVDALRLRGGEALDGDALIAAALADPRADGERTGAELGERERIREALERLPTPQRRAVVLAVWFGRTAREIGELDDVPLGTVKTRIRAGFARLRAELEVCGDL